MELLAVLAALGFALVLLVVLITWAECHPFLALLLVSLILGPTAGLNLQETLEAFLTGFGRTLRWIAVVIVLGSLIGELLRESGGTLRIARTVLRAVGEPRLPLAMGITGYVVSIPAFVDVAYIMLRPIVEALAVAAGRPVLLVGLSLVVGLTASHALLPPTPGPLAAAGILEADLGRLILLNAVVALCSVAAGLGWILWAARRATLPYDERIQCQYESARDTSEAERRTSWLDVASFLPVLFPLALIAAAAFLPSAADTNLAGQILRFLGQPLIALLIGCVIAAFMMLTCGAGVSEFNRLLDRSIESSAAVILITGAGGGFGEVIKAVHAGEAVRILFEGSPLPGLLFPYLLAMALTTATGSITVSMVTSASVLKPMLPMIGLSPELAATAVGAGSLALVHANSSLFWLISRLHDVPAKTLYRIYTTATLFMALGALIGLLLVAPLTVP